MEGSAQEEEGQVKTYYVRTDGGNNDGLPSMAGAFENKKRLKSPKEKKRAYGWKNGPPVITPERRAAMSEARRAILAKRKAEGNPINTSRYGIPDGKRRLEAELVWAVSAKLARLDMAELKQAGVLDGADAKAEEALQSALEVMRSPLKQETRLAAARLVLDFTKAKPASKSDITVNKAEDWLASVVADNVNSAKSGDTAGDEGETA